MAIERRLINKLVFGTSVLGATGALAAGSKDTNLAGSAELDDGIKDFIIGIPKAETHVHIYGCVTPELLIKFATRNGIEVPYESAEDVELFIATAENGLAAFITLLDQVTSVLKTGEDYYELTSDYLKRSSEQNVKYAEVMFGPQFALENKLPVSEQLDAMNSALSDVRDDYEIDGKWIMTFRRDRPVADALKILEQMENHRENIVAIGLSELDTPHYTRRFKPVFDRAHELGYKRTTHVDVNEPDGLTRVNEAISSLQVDGRIDHGISGLRDEQFVRLLKDSGITLSVAPVMYFGASIENSPYFRIVSDAVKYMLDNDIRVSISTDDPGIFALNYLADTYLLVHEYLSLSRHEVATLAKNSFEMLWIEQSRKEQYLLALAEWVAENA